MQIIAPKKMLVERLTAAASVVDKKSPNLANANVRLVAEDGQLTLSGFDGYRGLTCAAGGDGVTIATIGSVGLHAKDLLERVKTMPDGPVQIDVDPQCGTTIRAVGAHRRFRISGIPSNEFQTLPDRGDTPPTLTLPGEALADLIARVRPIVSTDETRPHINSALFEFTPGHIRLVATDGHRAIYADRVVEGLVAGAPIFHGSKVAELLVPLKGLGDIAAMAHMGGLVTMTVVGDRNAFFEVGGTVLSVRLTDAPFPPYRQVFMAPSQHPIRVARAAMIELLNAVSVAANAKTGGVKITAKAGRLIVQASDTDLGDSHDEMNVDYSGPDVCVGVNAKYLVDALGGMAARAGGPGQEDNDVLLSMHGELDPIRVAQVAPDPELTIVGVVMPMRI